MQGELADTTLLQRRHSPVIRKFGRYAPPFLALPPSSLPRFAASDEARGAREERP